MIEFFNEDPKIEQNIEISNNFISCLYCGIINEDLLVQCGECNHKFCNGTSEFLFSSHFLTHMKKSHHNIIKMEKKKLNELLYFDDDSFEKISCGYCNESNISELYFNKDIQNKKIEFLCQEHYNKKINDSKEEEKKNIKNNFKRIICEEKRMNENKKSDVYIFLDPNFLEIPNDLEDINLLDECFIESIVKNEEIIQSIDPIIQRFLNKVKDKYVSSDEYYEIYKPLIFSEYKYVKKIYESKKEYPIELCYAKIEKKDALSFIINNDFNGINFNIGKRIQLYEEPRGIEDILNISNNDYEGSNRGQPIWFTGCVIDIISNKKEYKKKLLIIPLDRNINDIIDNLGIYFMKENFCEIPYVRMLKGLDYFINDRDHKA